MYYKSKDHTLLGNGIQVIIQRHFILNQASKILSLLLINVPLFKMLCKCIMIPNTQYS